MAPKYSQSKPVLSNKTIQTTTLLLGLFVWRLVDALTIKTFFQPDEYFQSLEPAWEVAFGKHSGAWITWEWREHLRSSIHPLLFAGVYKTADQLCNVFNVTRHVRGDILVAAPKVLQAIFAGITDLFTYRLASRVYGVKHPATLAALALTVFSPWNWFCSVRTLSNSLETALTVIALSFWPWKWHLRPEENKPQQNGNATRSSDWAKPAIRATWSTPGEIHLSLAAAGLACILRQTNLMVWATMSIVLAWNSGSVPKVITLGQYAVFCGSTVLTLSVGMDRMFYDEWVFPPLRFVYFNVVQSLAVFYGNNRPDYYLTEGLPLLLTTALPFAAYGLFRALQAGMTVSAIQKEREQQTLFALAMSVVTSIVILSSISHKEVRFIFPLLPVLHVLAAKPVAICFDQFPVRAKRYRQILLTLALVVNVFIAGYTGYVHQRGVVDVIHYIRHEHEQHPVLPSIQSDRTHRPETTVGFLMPCHSTPWRSHLVYPEIKAWALTCEPPLNLTMAERKGYLDEADVFYANPDAWIKDNMEEVEAVWKSSTGRERRSSVYNERRQWPKYLIFFQQLESTMHAILDNTRYEACWRGFNTHWHDDSRRQGDVVVWCLR